MSNPSLPPTPPFLNSNLTDKENNKPTNCVKLILLYQKPRFSN